MQTLDLLAEVLNLSFKVPYSNLFLVKSFLARAKLTPNLLLVVLEELNLLFVGASLALLIANDLIVSLSIRLQLLDLGLSITQTLL